MSERVTGNADVSESYFFSFHTQFVCQGKQDAKIQPRIIEVAKEFFFALATLPDLLGAAVMTGAAVCTLGRSRWLNKALASEFRGAAQLIPHLFKMILVLNPVAEWNKQRKSWAAEFSSLTQECVGRSVRKGSFFTPRVLVLCCSSIQLIIRAVESAIGAVAAAFSLLTLGFFSNLNTLAVKKLEAPLLLVFDATRLLLGLINPEAIIEDRVAMQIQNQHRKWRSRIDSLSILYSMTTKIIS